MKPLINGSFYSKLKKERNKKVKREFEEPWACDTKKPSTVGHIRWFHAQLF